MKLKPLNNFVIVEAEKEKEEKIGSIYIPQTAKKQIQKTTIINKSDNCRQVQIGETVISRIGAGTPFSIEGKDLVALDEQRDLICTIEE